ncbi:MAG: hypothetical protein AABW54_04420 [Candidatus Micrarchaeota archaeon]
MVVARLMVVARASPGDGLEQFCRGIRLVSNRDTGRTVVQVLRAVLSNYPGGEFGSTELSRAARLNRITCIHHLKRLSDAGIVEKDDSRYRLRVRSMDAFMEEMRREMLASLAEMEKLAFELDEDFFGMRPRRGRR